VLDPKKIKSRPLKAFVEKQNASKINPLWRRRVEIIIDMLGFAASPEELRLPGLNFHELKGERAGTYSVLVSRNWRITFRWDEEGPYDVDLEDYHG
jgi:proteic killer suppression protein